MPKLLQQLARQCSALCRCLRSQSLNKCVGVPRLACGSRLNQTTTARGGRRCTKSLNSRLAVLRRVCCEHASQEEGQDGPSSVICLRSNQLPVLCGHDSTAVLEEEGPDLWPIHQAGLDFQLHNIRNSSSTPLPHLVTLGLCSAGTGTEILGRNTLTLPITAPIRAVPIGLTAAGMPDTALPPASSIRPRNGCTMLRACLGLSKASLGQIGIPLRPASTLNWQGLVCRAHPDLPVVAQEMASGRVEMEGPI